MDGEHIHMNTIEIMIQYFESKDHCCLLDIVSRVMLVNLKMSRGIVYNITILY